MARIGSEFKPRVYEWVVSPRGEVVSWDEGYVVAAREWSPVIMVRKSAACKWRHRPGASSDITKDFMFKGRRRSVQTHRDVGMGRRSTDIGLRLSSTRERWSSQTPVAVRVMLRSHVRAFRALVPATFDGTPWDARCTDGIWGISLLVMTTREKYNYTIVHGINLIVRGMS